MPVTGTSTNISFVSKSLNHILLHIKYLFFKNVETVVNINVSNASLSVLFLSALWILTDKLDIFAPAKLDSGMHLQKMVLKYKKKLNWNIISYSRE